MKNSSFFSFSTFYNIASDSQNLALPVKRRQPSRRAEEARQGPPRPRNKTNEEQAKGLSLDTTTTTHLWYVFPDAVKLGQGRYALMGHQPNPGTDPMPPMIRPSPSHNPQSHLIALLVDVPSVTSVTDASLPLPPHHVPQPSSASLWFIRGSIKVKFWYCSREFFIFGNVCLHAI